MRLLPHVLLVPCCLALLVPVAPQTPQQQPTFRARTDVVAVDVHVVDGSGRPVADLRPDDFTITVEGSPRSIVAAEYISYPSATAVPPRAQAPPPSFSTNRLLPASPPGRWILLVIDEENILAGHARQAAEAAARFLDQVQPDDRVGLVVPKSRTHIEPTTDRGVVKEALQHVVGHLVPIERGAGIALTLSAAFRMVNDPKAPSGESMAYAWLMVADARERVRSSVGTLRGLLEGVATVPGPKTIVFISQELPVSDLLSERADFNAEIAPVTAAAARARATCYVLHLDRPPTDVEERSSSLADAELRARGLETVASVTGGKRLMVSGRVEAVMDRVGLDISGYYLLGFRAEAADRDGAAHAITVTVKRPGLDLRARPMFAFSEEPSRHVGASTTDVVSRLLRTGEAATELPISLTTYVLPDPVSEAGTVRLLVAAEIDHRDATEAPTAVGYVILDASGQNAGGVVEQVRLTPSPADPLHHLPYLAAAVVPPGRYVVRLAAVDAASRAGSVAHAVEARLTAAGPLALGDLIVFDQYPDASGKPRPSVAGTVAGSLTCYLEAHSLAALTPDVAVRLEVAETVTGPARAAEAMTPQSTAGGRVQLSGSVAVDGLPTGDYVARAVVSSSVGVLGRVVRPVHILATSAPPAPLSVVPGTTPAVAPDHH